MNWLHGWQRKFIGMLGLCAAFAVQASEITLYEDPEFAGRRITLTQAVSNLSERGFNDRVSSIVITSGRWEVCTDANFRGRCQVFTRGMLGQLNREFNERISSVRDLDAHPATAGAAPRPVAQTGELTLYEEGEFRGRRVTLRQTETDLGRVGFNDRVSSLVITAGRWELCTQPWHRGRCTVVQRGMYAQLPHGVDNRISSVRELDSPDAAPIGPLAHPPTAHPPVAQTPTPVAPRVVPRAVLYREEYFQGRPLVLSGATASLESSGFEDQVRAMEVESDWEVCAGRDFASECVRLPAGRYPTLPLEYAAYNSMSSLRPVGGAGPAGQVGPPSPHGQAHGQARPVGVELFSEADFRGTRLLVQQETQSLRDSGFNDKAESLIIHSGRWELCTDSRFRGQCSVMRPGRYPRLGELAGQISSLRPAN